MYVFRKANQEEQMQVLDGVLLHKAQHGILQGRLRFSGPLKFLELVLSWS